MPHNTPRVEDLRGVVSQEVLDAMRAAHDALEKAGIRHLLVGALAVGAYGYPRASKDVDFLLGDEAFNRHEAGLITLKPGVPVEFKGVTIDTISVFPGCQHLAEALNHPITSDGIPVVTPEALIYMKLVSPRRKDAVDIVEMLKSGLDQKRIVKYLEWHAPDLLEKFHGLSREADSDES